MQALVLTLWELKRAIRNRRMLAILLGVPFVAALLYIVLAASDARRAIALSNFLICAVLTAAVTYSRFITDRISGFHDGLRSTPITDPVLTGVRIVVGVVLFLMQTAIFFGTLALR